MNQELSLALSNTATFIALLPGFLAIFRWNSGSPIHRLLAILVWGNGGIGILAYCLAINGMANLYLLHFYIIFDFVLLTLIFSSVIGQKLVRGLLMVFPFLAIINSVFIEKLEGFNVINRSIAAFLIICYTLGFFTKTLREMKIQRLENTPIFWISIGAIFYYAASFFIFLFSTDLLPYDEMWLTYFGVHAIFTILLYIFYTIALWVRPVA